MNILFWILWVLDLLLLILAISGSSFRSSFGAGTDLNTLVTIGLVIILAASLIVKLNAKHQWISLTLAALPWLILLVAYLAEKKG